MIVPRFIRLKTAFPGLESLNHVSVMNFFPAELIKNGIDAYLVKSAIRFHGIYWLFLIIIVVVITILPFVYVDVSVQNTGTIRPVAEKTEIKASITELVDSVYVKEGQILSKGDTILTFLRSNPEYKIDYRQKRLNDFEAHLYDLQHLSIGMKPDTFSSPTRKQEYSFYIQQIREYETNLSKTKKDLARNQILHDKKVISDEEFENYQYEYNRAVNALASLKNNQIRQWQSDLNNYTNMREEMISTLKQEEKEKDLYVIICPVNGVIDQFNGIYKGSNIQSGSFLAVISPDSTLYAEIYVSPKNIGYIGIGMPVNIQVSAFNYNEWGIISGKVMEISSDFITDNSGANAFYKVKCRLDKNYLIRRNGIKGFLKKGMVISAHFMITKRSLFDLLYQKIDDWVNPTQYSEKNN